MFLILNDFQAILIITLLFDPVAAASDSSDYCFLGLICMTYTPSFLLPTSRTPAASRNIF